MYSEKTTQHQNTENGKWPETWTMLLFNIFKELLKKKEKMASDTFNNSTCSD